jgi:hypothetical protein
MVYARHRFSMAAIALALLLAIPAPMLAQEFSPLTTDQTPQVPQPAGGGVNWSGFGWGALSLLANIPYIPAKLLYATAGTVVGAGAWAVTAGNTQVANTVWRSSLGGDYVVTPGMLEGRDPISFSGPTSTAPAPARASLATASSAPYSATVASSSSPATPAVPAAPDQGTGPVGNRADRSIE